MTERWLPIAGYEGRYEVSDLGRVRSIARLVPSPRHRGLRRIKSRLLAPHERAGYPTINLIGVDHSAKSHSVHRLVAAAFVPNPDGHAEVNHIDADRTNNAAANLEWCDQSMNVAHAYRIGRRPVGNEHHFARLARDSDGRCIAAKHGGGWEREEFS